MFKTTWANIKAALAALFYSKTEVNNIVAGTMNGRAYPRRSDGGYLDFNWAGQGGTPTYVWGIGELGTHAYPYSPSQFSVSYANGAGNVGGWTQATIADQDNWRVTDTRFAGYLEYGMGGGVVNQYVHFSGGYVCTGYRFAISNGASLCNGLAARQPQIYIPNSGWRALGGW